MSERLAFGLIGCGEIAVKTSRCMLDSERVAVVHCMDVREDLAAELAGTHGARFTTKLEELLADQAVQAVLISTPHYLHAPQTIQAARAGKHVLVEKPIACTLTEADEMIDAARRAKVKLGVLHPMRFSFPWTKARELVCGGAVGEIVAVKIQFASSKPREYWQGGWTGRVRDDWRVSREQSGGGVLMMNLIHNLDALVSILDPSPQRIYAEYGTLCTPVEVEDFVSFVMRLPGGAIISADASSAAIGQEPFSDRIYGQKGQVVMTREGVRVFLAEPWQELPAEKWIEIPTPRDYPDSRGVCVEGFARAILEGGQVPVSGEEGRRALEIVRGAYLSMERGRPVEFPVQE